MQKIYCVNTNVINWNQLTYYFTTQQTIFKHIVLNFKVMQV